MYTVIVILIVIAAILMCAIVFVQESKGGGLASGFAENNSLLGVRKTTDFIEKATWTLAGAMVVLSVITVFVLPKASENAGSVMENQSAVEQAVNPNNMPGVPQTSATQDATPAEESAATEVPAAEEPAAEEAQ
ncbi:MAG: preprotein translocase subunit SecG [Bacteroidaceae bacterium]|nr:preprotein translocase subunit SecG [Bacteroidaceae bacterium]